ncbi:CHAT domain-containing protein [Oscillatoriales cyanobacterium LEGE 11467]|uniref:CHAT domain-containing protein n=1 Tax=Zarconia navalis LEGE 11467 TaxID=1828826 RepID=A0A928Z7S1_9CYAN|nr:CHAT domain-containing protein [Zarconia navalis LEGE 11467]
MKRVLFQMLVFALGFCLVLGLQVLPRLASGASATQTPHIASSLSPLVELRIARNPQNTTDRNTTSQNTTVDLEAQGRNLYGAGNFAEAARIWQQMAEAETDPGRRSMALSNLSLCWQKLGRWDEAQTAIDRSLQLLSAPDSEGTASSIYAQTLHIRGNLEFERGEYDRALEDWENATELYDRAGDENGVVRSQLDRLRAMRALGLYRRAETTLEALERTLETQPDSPLKVAGFRSQGNVLRVLGKFGNLEYLDDRTCTLLPALAMEDGLPPEVSPPRTAGGALRQSLEIATRLQSPTDIGAVQFSLGNTARAIYEREWELKNSDNSNHSETAKAAARLALTCYDRAASNANRTTKIQAQLDALSLRVEWESRSDRNPLHRVPQIDRWPDLEAQIDRLPIGRQTIYARTDLARSLMERVWGGDVTVAGLMGGGLPRSNVALSGDAERLLLAAAHQARDLGDARAESYTLGYLGQFYEGNRQLEKAKTYTQNALLLAQSIQARDIAYQWQWQWGRILKNQTSPDRAEAIGAYTEAVKTLQSLRKDLVAISQDVQFDFRDRVEPVYRELVDLLLAPQSPSQDDLRQAREAIELLGLAELDNFFRDACVDAEPQAIDRLDPKAVAIYEIILADRLEFIVRLPGRSDLLHYRTIVPQSELVATIEELRFQLQTPYAYREIERLSHQIYQWSIAPIASQLTENETLVFVLDGELRNIPMAALYDGEKYLIEEHPVAIEPGLYLVDAQPLTGELRGLVAGLSEPPVGSGFSPLPYVREELQIFEDVGIATEQLLDKEFDLANLENLIGLVLKQKIHLFSLPTVRSRFASSIAFSDPEIPIGPRRSICSFSVLAKPHRETNVRSWDWREWLCDRGPAVPSPPCGVSKMTRL